jgi:hypothetical protein
MYGGSPGRAGADRRLQCAYYQKKETALAVPRAELLCAHACTLRGAAASASNGFRGLAADVLR